MSIKHTIFTLDIKDDLDSHFTPDEYKKLKKRGLPDVPKFDIWLDAVEIENGKKYRHEVPLASSYFSKRVALEESKKILLSMVAQIDSQLKKLKK